MRREMQATDGHTKIGATLDAVVPAQAGNHIPETTVCGTMGPRLRGDDTEYVDDTEHEEGHMT
jgi:hypothetical protein